MWSRSLRYTIVGVGGCVAGVFALAPEQPFQISSDVKVPLPDASQTIQTPNYIRTTEFFKSEGYRCEGWLFMPTKKVSDKVPVVIMGPGMSAQKDFGLEPFYQEFTSRGMAVFAFDYRTFGGSEGKPRQWVSGRRHVEDWHAAISHIRSTKRDVISRLGLWGSSFSGGHVVVAAAQDAEQKKLAAKKRQKAAAEEPTEVSDLDRVSCVISQVPYLGFHQCFTWTVPAMIQHYGVPYVVRGTLAAWRDLIGATFLNKPYYIKTAGARNDWGALTTPECLPGYNALIPPNPRGEWKNLLLGRLGMSILFYRPIEYLTRMGCPWCLVAAKEDSLCSVSVARHAATAILQNKVDFHELAGNHFDVYFPPVVKSNLEIQTKFLTQNLLLQNSSLK